MKGTFKITEDYLKELGACDKELSVFKKAYPCGGEYQEILNHCCAEGHSDWAMWLLHKVGATDDVRTYDGFVSDEKLDIVFAGRVEFKSGVVVRRLIAGGSIKADKGIRASESIEAGWDLKAGWGIKAGTSIKAGCDIKVGEGVEAGWDIEAGWSITAGTRIKAGGSIMAGTSLEAGWSIGAGWSIKAGEDYGIFAGLKVKVSLWKHSAKVQAKSKPENLISGYWEESNSSIRYKETKGE